MTPLNRNKISLYQDAKSTLSSLVKQTTQVFIGFIIMLLLTGGNPPGFIVALTVSLGIGFVAWSETKRLNKFEIQNSDILTSKPLKFETQRLRFFIFLVFIFLMLIIVYSVMNILLPVIARLLEL